MGRGRPRFLTLYRDGDRTDRPVVNGPRSGSWSSPPALAAATRSGLTGLATQIGDALATAPGGQEHP